MQAIIRAIKRGTISASKDIHGEWTIDAAELFRVYQPLSGLHSDVPSNRAINDASVYTPDVHPPRERVTKLERIIDTKDDVISAKDDTINDLRSRLNVEHEERRRLSMLLVDNQATP